MNNLTDDQMFAIWKKGFDSAANIANVQINKLLDPHMVRHEDLTVIISRERFDELKDKMSEGLYKGMKMSEGGLDYYLAATSPETLIEQKGE